MRVRLVRDEWWPVYSIEVDGPYEAELTAEEVARVKAAEKEFEACQDLLSAAVGRARSH